MPISFSNQFQKIANSIAKTSSNRTTKANPRFAFQYTINMTFVDGNGVAYSVDQNFIKYVCFDFDYEANTIPVIYVSFSATMDLYNLLMVNEKTGKVFFELYRDNKYSETSLTTRTIKGEFSYIPSTGNINYSQELENDITADNSYKVITIALINETLLNFTKTYINRIFRKVDTNTMIGMVLEKMTEIGDVIIKAPKYSVQFESELIPPITTVKQFLSYLFNQAPFYDTDFVFFLDFDKCYLLDKNGEGCEVADGSYHSVIFDISDVTNSESYYEGLELDDANGAYIVHINPANSNVKLNRSQDRVANRLVVIGEEGYNEDMDVKIDVNSTAFSTDKLSFIRATDATLIKNIMESNTVFFTVQKPYIDAQVFTPNKKYLVSNYGKDYNGVYTLAYKKEVIINNGGIFNESSEFGLNKVGNITDTGGVAAKNASDLSKGKYYATTDKNGSGISSTTAARNTTSSNYNVKTMNNPSGTKSSNNKVSATKYKRALLDASGPTKTLKSTIQNPDLMRKINFKNT